MRSFPAGRIGATITPQHMLLNRNALLVGGVRPVRVSRRPHRVAPPPWRRPRRRCAPLPRVFCCGIFSHQRAACAAAQHVYCLPILKREEHRAAVAAAATSGDPRFFLGTDRPEPP